MNTDISPLISLIPMIFDFSDRMGSIATMDDGVSLSLKALSGSTIVADIVDDHLLPCQKTLDGLKLSDAILPLIRDYSPLEELHAGCRIQ